MGLAYVRRGSSALSAGERCGLADVRCFVDEQLASDLRDRISVCRRLLHPEQGCVRDSTQVQSETLKY
eukprot:2134861-Amphidinium_carterae.1